MSGQLSDLKPRERDVILLLEAGWRVLQGRGTLGHGYSNLTASLVPPEDARPSQRAARVSTRVLNQLESRGLLRTEHEMNRRTWTLTDAGAQAASP